LASCRRVIWIFWRTVLLNDRSGLGGDTRLVGYHGQKRPGSTDFGDLVHDGVCISVVLASQAVNLGVESFDGLEIVQWTGSTCARPLHDVQVDHGGGDVGMTEKALNGADVGAGFEQVRRE
jgi:hypothetical protein